MVMIGEAMTLGLDVSPSVDVAVRVISEAMSKDASRMPSRVTDVPFRLLLDVDRVIQSSTLDTAFARAAWPETWRAVSVTFKSPRF